MKKKIIFVIAIFISIDSIAISETSSADGNDIKSVVSGNTDFAFALYDRLRSDPNALSTKRNLFFSPYSISTAFALSYGGARSQTKEQIATVLHFTLPDQNLYSAFGVLQKRLDQGDKSRGYCLYLANALWAQKGEPFLKEFLDLTQNYYNAELNQLDFVNEPELSRKIINSWVEEKTRDKIKGLIPPRGVHKDTVLILTNAIYFKGEWKTKFSRWKTKNADFSVSANQKVKAPFMHLKEDFKYCEDANLQVLEMPYKSDEISMLVILPRNIEGIGEVENTLTTEYLNLLLTRIHTRKVDVYFPKFKMTWGTFCLNDTLIALGMRDAFDIQKADFSGMNGKGGIWISDVFHKAFIEVNEEGTEAAAATGIGLSKSRTDIRDFRADHPFIFIIKDNRSGSILFMGRLMNPTE
jgi:serpin B